MEMEMCANLYVFSACLYPYISALKHGEPLSPAASTLAMVLTRGLSMEQQKSSRDSLQYSSGYSTQTNTPSCSEDTIPSQGNTHLWRITHSFMIKHMYSKSFMNFLAVVSFLF